MGWQDGPSPSVESGNQRRFFRQSIELPIAVTVRGLPAPVYGTLINVSESGCRIRSLILLDRDRIVEFTLHRPGRPPLSLRGRVMSRVTPHSDAGYEYGVEFEHLESSTHDALQREIAEMQRRAAAARAEERDAEALASPHPGADAKQRRRASAPSRSSPCVTGRRTVRPTSAKPVTFRRVACVCSVPIRCRSEVK